jgi:hypothetical protein
MSILIGDLNCYGSASMPDDNTPTAIGGAIDRTKTVEFIDVTTDDLQAVSSNAGDTTQSITVSYRDATGAIQTLVINLNGTTVVTNATVVERVLKAIKSATCAGQVALESQTAVRTGTAQAGGANTITLDTGASAVDDFYRSMPIRLTGGTGSGQIRKVVSYNGTSKVATVDIAWGTNPNSSSTFRVSKGVYFAKTPFEVSEVRRPFYNASADPSSAETFYDKIFLSNEHATLTLTTASVVEFSDPSGDITFALETTLDGTGTNGGGNNRQVAPSSGVGTFDSTTKTVATGQIPAASRQGVWLKLSLAAGATAQNTTYVPELTGATV